MWFGSGFVTHAMSEWAMDAHVSRHLFVRPATLMSLHQSSLSGFAEERLRIPRPITRRALSYLLCGERLLRRTRVSHVIYGTGRQVDRELVGRFDGYVRETSQRLRQINRLIAGEVPAWMPEVEAAVHEGHANNAPLLPADLFCRASAGH
jgi:hypothetical protein